MMHEISSDGLPIAEHISAINIADIAVLSIGYVEQSFYC